jgi:hypothetical protein
LAKRKDEHAILVVLQELNQKKRIPTGSREKMIFRRAIRKAEEDHYDFIGLV